MKPELYWLTLNLLLTGLLWIPYILNRILETGVWRTLQNPNFSKPVKAAWAGRLRLAHQNAVENLMIFAPLVLIAAFQGQDISSASQVYFFARLIHVVVYTLGIPVIPTLAFLAGFFAQLSIALTLLK